MAYVDADLIGSATITSNELTVERVYDTSPVAMAATVAVELSSDRVVLQDLIGSVSISTALAPDKVLSALLNSTCSITAGQIGNAVFNVSIAAVAEFLSEQGVVPDTGETWVLDRTNAGAFKYDNYNFSQFLSIGGISYGVMSDGVYQLDSGTSDQGIPIRGNVHLGLLHFDSLLTKRLISAFIGVSGGTLYVRVVDESGNAYLYKSLGPKDSVNVLRKRAQFVGVDLLGVMDVRRIKFGKGLQANYYSIELYNEDGDDMELANAEFFVVPLSRRI